MTEINRSKGTTPSERYLSELADHSFLSLWSYPNLYRDVVVNGKRTGKELCDLLVVCGDEVIIFSDKDIQWREDLNTDIAWKRWYKSAIEKSASQIRGAERWIELHPDRIFLDVACTVPLPIKIPPPETRRVHSVLVALGAHKACTKFFKGDSGSFMLRPSLMGVAHVNPADAEYAPFTIGDVDPDGSYIHVMNDVTLQIIMKELDTITDFTNYLAKKASFIRDGNLGTAGGEEELLHYYLTHLDGDEHAFTHPKENRGWQPGEVLALDTGSYESFKKNPQYIRKKEADRSSYVWDQLIEAFTLNMLAGTTITDPQHPFTIETHEFAIRHMAQETRLHRRLLGSSILGVLHASNTQDRTIRTMLPYSDSDRDTAYIFMTLAIPKMKLEGGYEQYRSVRQNMLVTYSLGILKRNPAVKRVIGIAVEPAPLDGEAKGSSEDMVMIEQPNRWTEEEERSLKESCEHFDMFREDRLRMGQHGVQEYPEE